MSNEFDWRREHTPFAKISRFRRMIEGKYSNGTKPEDANVDAVTYATLILEYYWDNTQPREMAEEVDVRENQILRWTGLVELANMGEFGPLKEAFLEESEIFFRFPGPAKNYAKALSNLADSIVS